MLGYIYKGVISSMYVYIHFLTQIARQFVWLSLALTTICSTSCPKPPPESASFASVQKPLSQDENAMAQQSHILAELVHST